MYGKIDKSTFSTYSKIICASIDCVNPDVLCANAKAAIEEYIEVNHTNPFLPFNFEDEIELWNIYRYLIDYKKPIEDHSLEIVSNFLTKPVLNLTIKGDHWWLFNWSNCDLIVWDKPWKRYREESIEFLMDDNFVEFKDLWLRREAGEDISCDRQFDLFELACQLGFHIERLFENGDQLLVRLPHTGSDYNSYYNEVPYDSLSYAR